MTVLQYGDCESVLLERESDASERAFVNHSPLLNESIRKARGVALPELAVLNTRRDDGAVDRYQV